MAGLRVAKLVLGALLVSGCAQDGAPTTMSTSPDTQLIGAPASSVSTTSATTTDASTHSVMPNRSADSAPGDPFDCAEPVEGAELIGAGPASVELIEQHLPLMVAQHADTVLIWERFGIQPDHLMVDGLPRMLVSSFDADERCVDIVAAVDRPDLVMLVEWSEEEYGELHELGSPPWRRLIESKIGTVRSSTDARRWTQMGTGLHGITSVTLDPGEEELAASLSKQFGPLIELSVGNFEFDPATGSLTGDDLCVDLPEDNAREGVVAFGRSLSGDDGDRMHVELVNGNEDVVHALPERVVELTERESRRTVTAFTGTMTAEARESTALEKGGLVVAEAPISFASCDPAGSALAAGTYEAAWVIRLFDAPASEGDHSDEVLVARMQIEIP